MSGFFNFRSKKKYSFSERSPSDNPLLKSVIKEAFKNEATSLDTHNSQFETRLKEKTASLLVKNKEN